MNVLITGGCGYIGSHVATVLLAAHHDLVLYDNLSNSSEFVVAQIQKISCSENIKFVKGDIRDRSLLQSVLAENNIDAVIHCAGLKAVGDSVINPLDYYENNVQGTISLLQALKKTQVRRFVFSSSATVYGDPHYLPIDENHPTNAVNPYGRTKLHIEDMLRDLAASDPAWKIICLRYFNPVGAHESGLIGENPSGTPNNLMPFVTQVAGGIRPFLSIFGNDYETVDGTGIRDYIHVMDLAEGHLSGLKWLESQKGWHTINLGTGQGYSVLEMVKHFEQASARVIPARIDPRRVGDCAVCYASVEKAHKELGWKARRSLQDMCQSAWNFQVCSVTT